ncbi:hypothetical protein COY07_00630 [Candidatus Peregrinibacteria bacterium CG_4_10_14_0_2_um_filter_43_11]|nr:MAG: hypothetical protein COY07_00630 [Candidatus Peregrinibacteria bacterium CG_4_10_14_0_2_um_filter_43_11]
MNEHDLLWAMLPEGLEEFFESESFSKTENAFRIILVERNVIPSDLPERYYGKKVINTIIKPITIDFFPIKGKKTDITLKRRIWKFEGIDEMFKRDIKLCAPGTKLEKEFADFLKELDRF